MREAGTQRRAWTATAPPPASRRGPSPRWGLSKEPRLFAPSVNAWEERIDKPKHHSRAGHSARTVPAARAGPQSDGVASHPPRRSSPRRPLSFLLPVPAESRTCLSRLAAARPSKPQPARACTWRSRHPPPAIDPTCIWPWRIPRAAKHRRSHRTRSPRRRAPRTRGAPSRRGLRRASPPAPSGRRHERRRPRGSKRGSVQRESLVRIGIRLRRGIRRKRPHLVVIEDAVAPRVAAAACVVPRAAGDVARRDPVVERAVAGYRARLGPPSAGIADLKVCGWIRTGRLVRGRNHGGRKDGKQDLEHRAVAPRGGAWGRIIIRAVRGCRGSGRHEAGRQRSRTSRSATRSD